MKNLKLPFLLILFALTVFTSCQDEVVEITEPSSGEIIQANSSLAVSMQKTTSNDGSPDNIIDGANCLTVQLPVTIEVNGIQITIDSYQDYEVIEAIFNEFNDDNDTVEIQFPITIILSDYTEITINSYQELEVFVAQCSGDNVEDDDIECIDFVYPFTISIYDASFQVIDTVTIENDEQLYLFIDGLSGGVLASINFPISMVLADGSVVTINNNDELEAAINNADGSCDEDDDNDYGDDNDNDIPDNDFIALLGNCTWTVDQMEIGDQNLEDQYADFVFHFNANGTVVVTNNGAEITGTWNLVIDAPNIQINLNIPNLPDFNNEHWILHQIEQSDSGLLTVEFRHGEDRLRFESFECNDNPAGGDCTESDVDGYLLECVWQVVNLNGSDGLINFELDFSANQELTITGMGSSILGTWSTSQSSTGGVEVVLDGIAGPDIQAINGSWVVVDCLPHRLELEMGDNHMVIEQNCNGNAPFNCFDSVTLEACDDDTVDGFTTFDLDALVLGAVDCTVNFFPSFHETYADAEANVNAIATSSAYVNTSNPQTVYLRIESDSGNSHVYEIGLHVVECANITVDGVVNAIVEGTWIVASYLVSGANETSVYANYTLTFNLDGSVVATDGGSSTFNGTWSAFLDSNNEVRFLLDFGTGAPFDEFNDDWYVFDLENNRLELHNVSGGSGSTEVLVFEKL